MSGLERCSLVGCSAASDAVIAVVTAAVVFVTKYINEYLPTEYQSCLDGLNNMKHSFHAIWKLCVRTQIQSSFC